MVRQLERRLSEFLSEEHARRVGLVERSGDADPAIRALEYDSRKATPGCVYFALPGLHTDGHRYVDEAVERGAAAVVYQDDLPRTAGGVAYLKVKNSRAAMSPFAAAFYGFPSRRLIVAGVTGTEGKSTTVYLIWQLLRLAGEKAGFFSTVQYSYGGEPEWNPEHQTTPEALTVQRHLWEMAENGCQYAVVEASSHGLSPQTNRLGDVEFDAAVLTNLNHEHLEFHGSWEQYRHDKANLFRALDGPRVKAVEPFGVVNADDPSAAYFLEATKRWTMSYSVKGKDVALSVKNIESSAFGNWYDVRITADDEYIDIRDRLPGAFNAGNVMAALLAASGMSGIQVRELAPLCPRLLPLRGRMTAVDKGQPFEVIVDYAHTPASFMAIFPPLRRRLAGSGGRIISLFGSAGERDTHKRGEQGKIAAAWSDFIVLTDEDPRGEQSMDILEAIAGGIDANAFTHGENLFLIPDRPAAIRAAIGLARPGDIVLLLGKGHENTIIYADHVMPFDEIGEAQRALEGGL